MIAKLLTAAIATVAAVFVVRQIADKQERERVRVRTNDGKPRTARLRRDPQTGIYRPED